MFALLTPSLEFIPEFKNMVTIMHLGLGKSNFTQQPSWRKKNAGVISKQGAGTAKNNSA